MGDSKKKKTEMEKKEESGSVVGFRELRDDLFREAAKLVSEDPSTRIAIFVTPPPSESDDSIHSFAHPSVESVVETFLEDKCPVPLPDDTEDDDDEEMEEEEEEDPSSKRFWWEDGKQFDSMNPEQLDEAYEKLMRVRNHMIFHLEAKERGQVSGNQQDQAGTKP